MAKKRKTFRIDVPDEVDIFIAFGSEWFEEAYGVEALKERYKVINFSESGVRFISDYALEEGLKQKMFFQFPWLKDSISLDVEIVRAIKKEVPVEPPEEPEDEDASSQKESEPETKTVYEMACRFVGLNLGMQDRLFRQVLTLERSHITSSAKQAAKNKKESEKK